MNYLIKSPLTTEAKIYQWGYIGHDLRTLTRTFCAFYFVLISRDAMCTVMSISDEQNKI